MACRPRTLCSHFFFFNDTATTEIYTLSLHALFRSQDPIGCSSKPGKHESVSGSASLDRKSTRLNSSHGYISYAVFCLKKKSHLHPEQRCHIALVEHLCLGDRRLFLRNAPSCPRHPL